MTMNPKREYFNKLAPAWDTFPTEPDTPARIRRFLERSALPGARWILDVGCGTGILQSFLPSIYPDPACTVEFDLAEAMLAENARKFTCRRVLHVCGDAQTLPFKRPSFDVVLCFNVLPHLGDVPAVIPGLLQVLRPGGTLSVGHLSASKELNEFHGSLDGPIKHDRLLPARDLAAILRRLGALVTSAEDEPGSYFVRAEKRNE